MTAAVDVSRRMSSAGRFTPSIFLSELTRGALEDRASRIFHLVRERLREGVGRIAFEFGDDSRSPDGYRPGSVSWRDPGFCAQRKNQSCET